MSPKPGDPVPPPQTGRRVYHEDKEIRYRDSSIVTSSDAGGIRSSSRPVGSVDGQLYIKPIPTDFQHREMFGSSPPRIEPEAPVTRARARAMSQAFNVTKQTGSGNLVDSTHQVENPKSKKNDTENDGHQLPLHLARQNSPISIAVGRQAKRFINSFDGPVEEHSSADIESEVSSVPESPKSDTDDEDDEYRLSESEDEKCDSEQSIINEIIKPPRKTMENKPTKTTNSSKPRGKQAVKPKAKTAAITTRKIGRQVTNKTTVSAHNFPEMPNEVVHSPERSSISLDEFSPTRQNIKATTGSSKQKRKDVIPDSQDFIADSQEKAVPLKPKTKAMNNRRPKKPFNQDGLSVQQTNPNLATPICSITDTYEQPTTCQGKVPSPSPNKRELPGNRGVQASGQKKHTFPHARELEATRPRGHDGVKPNVDEGKGRAIDQTQPVPTSCEVGTPPINQLSDQPSQFSNAEYAETHLQSSPSYYPAAETNERPCSSEPIELLEDEIKETHVMKESFSPTNVSTQVHLPHPSSSPLRLNDVVETKNEATQTKNFEAQSLIRNIDYRGLLEDEPRDNDTTRYQFLRSPQIQEPSGLSRMNPIAIGVRKENKQVEKVEKYPSAETFRDLPNVVTPLHPTSRVWAQGIAKKSRQNNLKIAVPQTNAREAGLFGRTPRTISESPENPISKRETALGGQRNAIFESIQEVTMAVLQHLEFKESAIDSIVGNYQRSGQHVLDMILHRQSIELGQAVADFDRKCIRLGGLFEESARHTKMIGEHMSNEKSRHLRDWARRNKELEKTMKLAREALAST
ncbi:hypothetical protein F4859DRAFT_497347 [Xylaria cf. heliscus]|nr:hypothetical protein F4859DRAFT_497347 [Xylaria cf. heliscus]